MSKIRLVAPEGVTSTSWAGEEYKVDENGVCEVPSDAALTLYGFGFGNAPAKPETPAEKKAREKAEAEAKAAAEKAAAEAAADGNAPAAPAGQ
jgi:hypothetical protein